MGRVRRVSDDEPGIRRRRCGRGFTYIDPAGVTVRGEPRLRIQALAIPPAWTDVWICTDPWGHIQATGRDSHGRKQYIYHQAWRRVRDARKYERLGAFGEALPALRERVEEDLCLPGMPRRKAVAAVVRVMERSFIRVGSRRYMVENNSFGASTLRVQHLAGIPNDALRLRFPGKGGQATEVVVEDAELADVVREGLSLPGDDLFAYQTEDGGMEGVDADDVNAYLARAMDGPFTAKDLRTWAASVLMLDRLAEAGPRPSKRQRLVVLRRAVKEVAEELHHTPAVCRRSYIHPLVPAAYHDGSLARRVADPEPVPGLWPEETRLLALLRSYA